MTKPKGYMDHKILSKTVISSEIKNILTLTDFKRDLLGGDDLNKTMILEYVPESENS